MSYTETVTDGTVFGDVPGIQAGTFFRTRRELHDKKLHRGLMNGIATGVLSGGYVDDEDLGDVIIYTGEGGRDQRTGRQIADQQLTQEIWRWPRIICGAFLFGSIVANLALKICPKDFDTATTDCIAWMDTGRKLDEMGSRFGGFEWRERCSPQTRRKRQPELERPLNGLLAVMSSLNGRG